MKIIHAAHLNYRDINDALRQPEHAYVINDCCGQRFIAAGMSDKTITINGIAGNALGAYLNTGKIIVHANAQDAVGDTMNGGTILIHGNVGDAVGYAMRGGRIYISGNAGYRAGIHMKAYQEKIPVIIIGGCSGSFLGEYQSGGIIIVLGLHELHRPLIGNFPCTGMHGGKLFLRGSCEALSFPSQVTVREASDSDMQEIFSYLSEYCNNFQYDLKTVLNSTFTVVTPSTNNPYQQMYVAN